MKINLHDLEAHLFPENYPFNTQYFGEERAFVGSTDLAESYNYQNMSFRIKLVKLSLNVKKADVRICIFVVYNKLFSDLFRYDKDYNWCDLKVLLCFFIFTRDATSFKDLESILKNPNTMSLLRKYKPNQNT